MNEILYPGHHGDNYGQEEVKDNDSIKFLTKYLNLKGLQDEDSEDEEDKGTSNS